MNKIYLGELFAPKRHKTPEIGGGWTNQQQKCLSDTQDDLSLLYKPEYSEWLGSLMHNAPYDGDSLYAADDWRHAQMGTKGIRRFYGLGIWPEVSGGMNYQPAQDDAQYGYKLPSGNVEGEYIPDGGIQPEVEVIGNPYEITEDMPWSTQAKKNFQQGLGNVMNGPTVEYEPWGSRYYQYFPTVPSTDRKDMRRKKYRRSYELGIWPEVSGGMDYQPAQDDAQYGYVLPSVNIEGEYIPDGGMLPEVEVIGDPYEITEDMPWYTKAKKKFQRGWSKVMNAPTMAYVPGGSGYYPSFPTVPSTVGQDLTVTMMGLLPFVGSSAAVGVPTTMLGIGNLASRDGVEKTMREYKKGNYGNAAKSLAGDILNILPATIGSHGLYNAPIIGQYPRYIGGKLKYGFDAELPTVYRKLGEIPEVENGTVTLTRTPSSFRDMKTGKDPRITNFTTDAPVRAHKKGKWYDTDVIALDGKTLLGHKVVSTRPSDTFTYDDIVRARASKARYLTGDPERLAKAKAAGYKTYTSERLQNEYDKAEAAYQQALKEQGGFGLAQREKYFPEYARALEDETRTLFKSPTEKDYAFMDYVFRPEYKSEVINKVQSPFYLNTLRQYPKLGEWYNDYYGRLYLNDRTRWRNVMYDPATDAEYLWREANGIKKLE